MTVPDQLRSAVSVPGRYEPTINRTYSELGRHYETAIVPAQISGEVQLGPSLFVSDIISLVPTGGVTAPERRPPSTARRRGRRPRPP